MDYKPIYNKKSRVAMTLAEMMVTVGVSSILFLGLGSLTLYSARSFCSMENYSELNQSSRMGLDKMTRDIRECRGLTIRTPTNLVFKTDSAALTNMNFTWNKSDQTVTRIITWGTNSVSKVLLENCIFWTNQVFQRNTISNSFALVPSTNYALAKLIQLNWVCSERRVNTTNSESVQSMKIVIRKKS